MDGGLALYSKRSVGEVWKNALGEFREVLMQGEYVLVYYSAVV